MMKKREQEFLFEKLSPEDRVQYLDIALRVYGNPHAMVGLTGEPLYFNPDFSLNPIHVFVLDQINMLKNKN